MDACSEGPCRARFYKKLPLYLDCKNDKMKVGGLDVSFPSYLVLKDRDKTGPLGSGRAGPAMELWNYQIY